jgi:hypothetical protein
VRFDTQNNLGAALNGLGVRERATGKLEEAIAAYREALREFTPEAAPCQHKNTQKSLNHANKLLTLLRIV